MPLNGDVKTFPLSAIVQMVHDESKTGILTVTTPKRRCGVFFRGGKIIHVRGNTDKELKLGALLKVNNLITEDRLQDMLAVSKAMEKRLGILLLERKYIELDKLVSIIHLQFKEIVATMLSWDDAKFSYKDGLDGFEDEIKCEVDPVRLVAEAKKRGEFKGIIPNDQVVFQINPKVDTSKSVHAARDLRVLLLLDGRRNVAQVIKETGYSKLAAYRSLASLYAQNAIVRKDAAQQPTKTGTLELTPITSIYLALLQLIIADLAKELGGKKATTSLENCLRQSGYYEQFLGGLQLDQDLATNVGKMQALLNKYGQAFSHNDLINGYNQVVVRLLGEQYQFLGHKATRSTVQRLRAALEQAPATQRNLAQAISRFLEHYENEDFLRGAKAGVATAPAASSGAAEDRTPPVPKLNNMTGSAIVNFYNDMFQLVITDLEREVGAKARSLFQGLIRSSQNSENALAQFELLDSSDPNPLRLKDNVNTKELRIKGQDLVQAFQQVLRGLLAEESRILGPKATELTLSRLADRVAAKHVQFKPLVEQLSASITS